MLVVSIAQFYVYKAEISSIHQSDNENIVNNVVYTFVFLMPYLFLLKERKLLSLLLSFVMLFFIIQGAKRGAMISGVIGMTFFAYYQLKTIDKKITQKVSCLLWQVLLH